MRERWMILLAAGLLAAGGAACDAQADSPLVEDTGTVETPTDEGTTAEPTDEPTDDETELEDDDEGDGGDDGGNSGPG
jgi:hypothetical protein